MLRAWLWIAGCLLLIAGCHRHKAPAPIQPHDRIGTWPGTSGAVGTPEVAKAAPVAAGDLVKPLDVALERLVKAGHDPALLPKAAMQGRADLAGLEKASGAYRFQHKTPAGEKFAEDIDSVRGHVARAVAEAAAAAHIVTFGGTWTTFDQSVVKAQEEVKAAHGLLASAP